MPTQPITVMQVDECPMCKGTDVLSKKAFEVVGLPRRPNAISLEASQPIPMENPILAGLTISVMTIHWDICTHCGTRYCVKAVVTKERVEVQQQGRQN